MINSCLKDKRKIRKFAFKREEIARSQTKELGSTWLAADWLSDVGCGWRYAGKVECGLACCILRSIGVLLYAVWCQEIS